MKKTMKYNNLIQVMQYFKNEKKCKEHLAQLRWNGKPVCPFCDCKKVYETKAGYKCSNPKCYKKFTVTVGTFFENTKIELSKWFIAIYIATSHKKGISSLQLSKDINVTQKTAWFMLHRIREMLRDKAPQMLSGIIEADETYVGGKNKNRHNNKKIKGIQGRSVKDKTPVLGLFQRNGLITSKVVKDTKASTIQPIIKETVKQDSALITDEWHGYHGLKKDYNHKVVNHGKKQYVIDGVIHTNTLEGFWSLLKRGIIGIYHQISEKHLERYCKEFDFRYNTRAMNEENRFDTLISKCKGRMTYKELIAD